jgi:hypothetical protein
MEKFFRYGMKNGRAFDMMADEEKAVVPRASEEVADEHDRRRRRPVRARGLSGERHPRRWRTSSASAR